MRNTIKIGTATALAVACTALFGGGCEKKATLQNTFVVEYWTGTNYHKATLTREQYYHDFLLIPDYEAGEPNAKLEVTGALKK